MVHRSLVAVDIGNARIKFGLFGDGCPSGWPEPTATYALDGNSPNFREIAAWLAPQVAGELTWWIASVNRPATTRLIDWLKKERPGDAITLLASGDLPLEVRLERPDMVGIDRLVDAVAVNRLRDAGRPAVIVDVGSAITVDLVSSDGAFLGGAILPGLQMSARALHEFTDLLPLIKTSELSVPPPPRGDSTVSAMQSGLFWGAVGAIRELSFRLGQNAQCECDCDGANTKPQVFLTGGAGAQVAELLGPEARHVPNLTLAGIATVFRA
jgi:type III pantothenate kinase